nr:hypothetical protein [Tanacetum cinerariifolium]
KVDNRAREEGIVLERDCVVGVAFAERVAARVGRARIHEANELQVAEEARVNGPVREVLHNGKAQLAVKQHVALAGALAQ